MSRKNFDDLDATRREQLARRVKSIRAERGIKQEDLAAAAGVSRQTLSNTEGGRCVAALLRGAVNFFRGKTCAP